MAPFRPLVHASARPRPLPAPAACPLRVVTQRVCTGRASAPETGDRGACAAVPAHCADVAGPAGPGRARGTGISVRDASRARTCMPESVPRQQTDAGNALGGGWEPAGARTPSRGAPAWAKRAAKPTPAPRTGLTVSARAVARGFGAPRRPGASARVGGGRSRRRQRLPKVLGFYDHVRRLTALLFFLGDGHSQTTA